MIDPLPGQNPQTPGGEEREGPACPRCGDTGWVMGWIQHDGFGHPSTVPCGCKTCEELMEGWQLETNEDDDDI